MRLQLASVSDIRWAIDRSYKATGGVGKMVQAFEAVERTEKRDAGRRHHGVVTENAPVVQVVDSILTQAIRDRASDVHIEASQDVIYLSASASTAPSRTCSSSRLRWAWDW